ncbi:discoidin domain-containing protein [Yoonia sp. SS1-5]|uniref:Discoidin domain-containing protein n=1 Tax=Yoonia rhodophyticola TaxID=3137370 RepID=A0AAN0NLV0_9RHOB
MGRKLNNRTETFERWGADIVVVDETATRNNIDIFGTNRDETLILDDLKSWDTSSPDNIDIQFDGGDGDDHLAFTGNAKGINLELSDDDKYDFRLDGGHSRDGGDKKLSSLDISTVNVETFSLTNRADQVDVFGFGSGVTFFLKHGADWYNGTNFDDHVDGGTGNDELYGNGGNDYIDGGLGDDTIHGGTGDDIIIDQGGSNIIFGGQGRDTIYTTSDINADGTTTVYGDFVDEDGKAAGAYNAADTFFIGYETETYVYPDALISDGAALSSGEQIAMAGAGIGQIGGAIMYAAGGGVAGSIFNTGFTVGSAILGELIDKGNKASSREMTSTATTNQILIKDYDAWADTAVVALDAYADLVNADISTNTAGTEISFTVGGSEFLGITLDTTMMSVMEGSDEDLSWATSTVGKSAILNNLLMNSVIVETDGSASGATIKAMNGLNLSVGGKEQDLLESYFSEDGEEDGVWLIGDIGTSILFGHNLSALAGTQSNNTMYSGYYFDDTSTSSWYSSAAISMHGGAGNDVMFGSKDDGDKIYGGTGNDFLAGHWGLNDKLYGGAGTDVASFGTVRNGSFVLNQDRDSDGDVKAVGVYADLAVSSADEPGASAGYRLLAGQADAYRAGTLATDEGHDTGWDIGAAMAYLYDIEGLYGSDYQDVLYGDGGENALFGAAGADIIDGRSGNDYIDGGAGDDVLTGGAGHDVFSFTGGFGSDVITDFADGDTLVFEGLTLYQRDSLAASLNGNGSTITMKTSASDATPEELVLTGVDVTGLFSSSEKVQTEVFDEATGELVTQESYTHTISSSRAIDSAPLDDAEAWVYLASNPELIARYGDSIDSAKAHFEAYGRNGDTALGFNAAQYADNYGLSDVASAAEHFVKTGYGRGWSDKADITDSLDASAATQSSTHGGAVAANAIDNDRSTITHAATDDWTPHLSIDLGEDYILEAATLQNRVAGNHWLNDRLIGAKVEVRDDGEVVWTSDPLNDWVTQYLDFNGVVGDEVRITHTNRNLSVAELEIFGEALDNAVINLTDTLDTRAAFMTSEWANGLYGAENALDGDDSTLIHSRKNDNHMEFWLDLGDDAKIEYIDIANRGDTWASRLSNAELQILRDGNEVWSQDLTAAYDQMINTGGVIGDEVRIVQDGAALHIGEIDVLGQYLPNAFNNLSQVLIASDVSQSSNLTSNSIASNAIDGDYTTSMHTGHGDHSPWLEFDLGGDAFLKGVLLQNRYTDEDSQHFHLNQKLEDAKIEVLDGTTVVWSSDNLSGDVSQWIDFDGVVGDKIRLSSDNQYLHVAELDIIGDYLSGMTNITDTLSSSAATQSSTYNSAAGASNVLDGNSNSINHTRQDAPSWLSVDLGGDVDFEFIKIENRDDQYHYVRNRLDGATVEILDDGHVVWESDPINGDQFHFIDASGVTGDEVRVTLEDEFLHIAELDVYGAFSM